MYASYSGSCGIAPLLPLGHRERQRLVVHRVHDVDERHLGHDGGEQVRPHRHGTPRPAGRRRCRPGSPAGRAPPSPSATRCSAHGDQVGERVALLERACRGGTTAARARRRRGGGPAPTRRPGRAATGGRSRTTAASTPRTRRSRRARAAPCRRPRHAPRATRGRWAPRRRRAPSPTSGPCRTCAGSNPSSTGVCFSSRRSPVRTSSS